jgi:subtilisin family serine protease
VAFGARLVIGKVIGNNGFGLESRVIAGMEWAAARARIINMSLAGSLSAGRDPLSLALNRLTASRHVLFAATAGDSGPSDLTIQTPGAADAALDVTDITVIALWLGHEQITSAQIYLHADMEQKERAIARVSPPGTAPGRYHPPHALMAFLNGL